MPFKRKARNRINFFTFIDVLAIVLIIVQDKKRSPHRR